MVKRRPLSRATKGGEATELNIIVKMKSCNENY